MQKDEACLTFFMVYPFCFLSLVPVFEKDNSWKKTCLTKKYSGIPEKITTRKHGSILSGGMYRKRALRPTWRRSPRQDFRGSSCSTGNSAGNGRACPRKSKH